MNYLIKFRDWYISNLIILFATPVIVLSMIHISFGKIIETFFLAHTDIYKLYQLQAQVSIFTSELDLPMHVKELGICSIIFIYIVFYVWLVLHGYQSYIKLSHREGSKAAMLFETVVMLVIYSLVISPGLLLLTSAIGYFLIIALIVIIILYWIKQ